MRLKLPVKGEAAVLSPPPQSVRIKLKVSADTKRHLAGNVLRLPAESGMGEIVVVLGDGTDAKASITTEKLESCGVIVGVARGLSKVLRRGLGDWVWNGHVALCNYQEVANISENQLDKLSSVASLGTEQRVHYSIRFGETELVNMTLGFPPEPFVLGSNWARPNVAVTANAAENVLTVCEVLPEGGVRVQTEGGDQRTIEQESLRPVLVRKAREPAVVLCGVYAGRWGRVVAVSDSVVQLQLEDDNFSSVVVPAAWVARRREVRSVAEVVRMKDLMAQRDLVVSALSPSAAASVPEVMASSMAGRRIKVKKLNPDFVVSSVEKKKRVREDKPSSDVIVPAATVSAEAVPALVQEKSVKVKKRKDEQSVSKSSAGSTESVLRYVGTPDDNPVPLRGSPPEWLFHNWQGAMLVKVHSFPMWPCRVGSTLDLSSYPSASLVPDVQKQAFVYFFGDKTVAWTRFDALSPWPGGSAEEQAEELAKIVVSKKHATLWNLACEEASDWNRHVATMPSAPAPIDKDPATSIMQPVGRKKKKKKQSIKRGREIVAEAAGAVSNGNGIALSVEPPSVERRKRSSKQVSAPEAKNWVDYAVCNKCGSTDREDVILLCDSAFCSAAQHTYCCDPPLSEVPAGSWFCPAHALAETVFCGSCGRGDDDDLILLCDAEGCNAGYHMFCLQPPLVAVPRGEWLCPRHAQAASPEMLIAPVRPQSAFTMFEADSKEQILADNPNATPADVARIVLLRWQQSETSVKAKYAKRSAEDKARFDRETKVYNARLGPLPLLETPGGAETPMKKRRTDAKKE